MEKKMDGMDNIVNLQTKNDKRRSKNSDSGRPTYSSLTTTEKWEWHADDYAFRIVVLREPWEGLTSPCDPEHKWFNRDLIEQAVARKRAALHARQDWNRKADIEAAQEAKWRKAAKARAEHDGVEYREPGRDLAAEGRRLCDEWAVKNGYLDFETAQRFGATYTAVVKSFVADKRMPLEPGERPMSEAEKSRIRQESIDRSEAEDGA